MPERALRKFRPLTKGAQRLARWYEALPNRTQQGATEMLGLKDSRHFARLLTGEMRAGLMVANRIQAITGIPAPLWLEEIASDLGRKAS